MNNYPPGVSGNEPQITGEWPCFNCGATLPEDCEGDVCPGGCAEPDYDTMNVAHRERDEDEMEEPC